MELSPFKTVEPPDEKHLSHYSSVDVFIRANSSISLTDIKKRARSDEKSNLKDDHEYRANLDSGLTESSGTSEDRQLGHFRAVSDTFRKTSLGYLMGQSDVVEETQLKHLAVTSHAIKNTLLGHLIDTSDSAENEHVEHFTASPDTSEGTPIGELTATPDLAEEIKLSTAPEQNPENCKSKDHQERLNDALEGLLLLPSYLQRLRKAKIQLVYDDNIEEMGSKRVFKKVPAACINYTQPTKAVIDTSDDETCNSEETDGVNSKPSATDSPSLYEAYQEEIQKLISSKQDNIPKKKN